MPLTWRWAQICETTNRINTMIRMMEKIFMVGLRFVGHQLNKGTVHPVL